MSNRDKGSQPSNPALERLGVLVGEWNIEITAMSFRADKTALAHGRTSFNWIEGGAFLLQRSEVQNRTFRAASPSWVQMIQRGAIACFTSTHVAFPGFIKCPSMETLGSYGEISLGFHSVLLLPSATIAT